MVGVMHDLKGDHIGAMTLCAGLYAHTTTHVPVEATNMLGRLAGN